MSVLAAFSEAARDTKRAWHLRASLAAAGFGVAAFAPLVFGDSRLADLAGGLYLALAATGLAFAVGVGGLPSLAQGAFVAVGAVVSARLLQVGVPTVIAAPIGAATGAASAAFAALLFLRLPRAGIAAATWIVAWLVATALESIGWFFGGTDGLVVTAGPSPAGHYELALALTALAGIGFAALARSSLGLGLAAGRDREAAAAACGIPMRRLRVTAFAVSGAAAGLAGALGVELAGIGDPSQYGPYLSFKLFVVVLVGGAVAPLGAIAGVIVLGVLSIAADAIGSVENVAHARSHALLAAIMLLGVVSLGWDGVLSPGRRRFRADGSPPVDAATRRGLIAHNLIKRYGAVAAADDVSLTLEPGSVTALVGPNGSGKTTVLRLLAGAVDPDGGSIEHDGVARTLQATAVFRTLTPLEHLLAAAGPRRRYSGFARSLFATPKARAEERELTADARASLERAGIPPDTPASDLPVGEQRLLMVLTAAASGAPTLLVDEPSAGASPADEERIVDTLAHLRDGGRAILVVEHNLGVVERIADRVIELDSGRILETA
ncbi:MAG TPA: ATP-binding cassette domain-containing protein [Gaiellaceae bacterium]|nr:ATP-binding cassette domain-containing protein [Gaiellaceae bacterium]